MATQRIKITYHAIKAPKAPLVKVSKLNKPRRPKIAIRKS